MLKSRNATGLRNNNKSGHLQCTSLAVAVRPTCCRTKFPPGSSLYRSGRLIQIQKCSLPSPPHTDRYTTRPAVSEIHVIIARLTNHNDRGNGRLDKCWSHWSRVSYTRPRLFFVVRRSSEGNYKFEKIKVVVRVNNDDPLNNEIPKISSLVFVFDKDKRIVRFHPTIKSLATNEFVHRVGAPAIIEYAIVLLRSI